LAAGLAGASAAGERWIIDGGYTTGSVEIRFGRADTIVLFDFPVWLCLWRACWRVVEFRNRTRPDMGPDCPEKVDLEFLNYIRTYRRRQLPKVEGNIARHFRGRLVRLRTPKDVEAFLATVPAPDRMTA
jgi:adenylate kinase family enzyme